MDEVVTAGLAEGLVEPVSRCSNGKPPWVGAAAHVLCELRVDTERGLSTAEVARRVARYGRNELRRTLPVSSLKVFANQFKSLVVALLVAAAAVSAVFVGWVEATAIAVVIAINALIGFFTELRAVRSMEALRRLGRVETRVRRDGQVLAIPAESLVPGDIVLLEGGDRVSADLRLFEASKLQADESTLTGESAPVTKRAAGADTDTPLADRMCMAFKGTSVTRGSGEGVVVATGMATELGQIATLVAEAVEEETPLEVRLEKLAQKLIWVTLVVATLTAVSGIASGKAVLLMIETGIALAVAAIPEGLPIVATIALARGMWRMSRRNALINRLSAVETLGATSVIFSDKTGTLTENRMTVTRLALASGDITVSGEGMALDGRFQRDGADVDPAGDPELTRALRLAVLCNNAALSHQGDRVEGVGDPLEVALLVAGAKAGLEQPALLEAAPEIGEEAFDPAIKMMGTFHPTGDGILVAVKGAAEAVLAASTRVATADGPGGDVALRRADRDRWMARNAALAEAGSRVLAVAEKRVPGLEDPPYEGLVFVGLIGMLDPPREAVRDSIDACRSAGIRVVMVTGDQSLTARTIAHAVGLVDEREPEVVMGSQLAAAGTLSEPARLALMEAPIFARMDPRQKLDLIAFHQERGAVVAMTGDGVNDAPALRRADIGVAMGKRGTQVAREAAAMVLRDDSFASIVAAIRQGRVVFENIRKFVFYLLSCNLSEVMIVSAAAALGMTLPLLPLQILFLNLVTDVFPALALGMGEGDPKIMKRPPRDRGEAILRRDHWVAILVFGLVIAVVVLVAMELSVHILGLTGDGAVTVSFLTLALAQMWHVFNTRGRGTDIVRNDVLRNPWVWGALALCLGLVGLALVVPALSGVLHLVDPGLAGWALVLGMSLIPLALGQIWCSLSPEPNLQHSL